MLQTTPALHEHGRHAVQFYEDSAYLCDVIADFIVAGLSNGDPALIIATEEHRSAVVGRLQARGVDIEQAAVSGRLTLADARDTTNAFLIDGVPDAERFEKVVAPMLERARSAGGKGVCAYGEMVDLLWRDGNPAGAVDLEGMWNDLAQRHSFRLLCAYAMDNFAAAEHGDRFLEICRQHDHVMPTEQYTLETGAERLVRISELQQRARALESELSYRKSLEARLYAALQERDELLERERLARTEAEAANRAKSDFLAVMSHELRTPLNAIAGYAELLELGVAGPIGESQREMVSRIQRSQRHLLSLIDEVLTFTRSEAVTRRTLEPVSMAEVIRAAELSLMPQMRARHLRFVAAVVDDSLMARGDAERIRQIMVNLLTNATKYTPAGGTIRVECDVDAEHVFVHVHDTGIGVSQQHVEAIFEPFYQVDAPLTRIDEGLGLGLAISRRFARAMNGDISVRSIEGSGSTFTLRLARA